MGKHWRVLMVRKKETVAVGIIIFQLPTTEPFPCTRPSIKGFVVAVV